jgi:hypothetical protein
MPTTSLSDDGKKFRSLKRYLRTGIDIARVGTSAPITRRSLRIMQGAFGIGAKDGPRSEAPGSGEATV